MQDSSQLSLNFASLVGSSAVFKRVGANPKDGYSPPQICKAAPFLREGIKSLLEDFPFVCEHLATLESSRAVNLMSPPFLT